MLVNIGTFSEVWVRNREKDYVGCCTLDCLAVKCTCCVLQDRNGNEIEQLKKRGRIKE